MGKVIKLSSAEWSNLVAGLESSTGEFDAGGYPIGGSYWRDGERIGSWGPWTDENWVVIEDTRYELALS